MFSYYCLFFFLFQILLLLLSVVCQSAVSRTLLEPPNNVQERTHWEREIRT